MVVGKDEQRRVGGGDNKQWEAKPSKGGNRRQNQARETNGVVVGGEGWSEMEGRG